MDIGITLSPGTTTSFYVDIKRELFKKLQMFAGKSSGLVIDRGSGRYWNA